MDALRALSLAATLVTLLAMIEGRVVREMGAALSVPDWPLFNGRLVPTMDKGVLAEWLHRFLILVVTLMMVGTVVAAWGLGGGIRLYTVGSLVLLLATAAVGGLSVVLGSRELAATGAVKGSPALAALDQAMAMTFFASLVAITTWCYTA